VIGGPDPSAGLLSVALDVTAGLRRAAPRVIGPSGLCYESGLCSELREESLPGSSWRSRAYQSGNPRRFGLLAPVVYLAGPSRGTAGGLLPHPFTHHLCRRLGPRPSAGLLSVALDVAAGLRRTTPRVVSPSGLSGPGSPRPSRVRTLLYAAGGASSARRRSDGFSTVAQLQP
jgi:hypothetical protein